MERSWVFSSVIELLNYHPWRQPHFGIFIAKSTSSWYFCCWYLEVDLLTEPIHLPSLPFFRLMLGCLGGRGTGAPSLLHFFIPFVSLKMALFIADRSR